MCTFLVDTGAPSSTIKAKCIDMINGKIEKLERKKRPRFSIIDGEYEVWVMRI